MSRYIDADALKANCDIMVGNTTIGRRDYVMFHEIDSAPSIDIVRCRECVSGTPSGIFCGEADMYICNANDQDLYEAEHFCSYGERREP